MRSRRHIGLVAAAATLLASAPLTTIFEHWTWFLQAFIVVALIAGVAALTRTLRGPLWAQALAMAGTLLVALTWLFPSGRELLAIAPTPSTFGHFGELLSGAVRDMRQLAVPVADTDALLFLTVLGVGAVAIVVDLCAAGMHRPALAGLPMLAIYSVPVAIYAEAVHPLPFIVGAAGFLWLLVADRVDRVRRFGHRYTGDGRDVDVWEPSPLAAAGRRLAVLGVVVAVLLPLAVPGMTGGLLDRLGGQSGGVGEGRPGIGGGPGRINLFAALSGQLRQTEVTELAKVTTTERAPGYLRFGVADVIRADGFGVRNPAGNSVTRGLPDRRREDSPGISQNVFRASVELTNGFNMPLLPVYAEPLVMRDVEASWRYDESMQIIFSGRSQSKGKKYSFDYVRTTYTPAVLNAAKPLGPDDSIRRQFTAVPEEVPEVSELVKDLTAGEQTDYAKVRKIYDHFSSDNGFSYSLATQGGTSSSDIVNFLTKKIGFCQQYAAAMAWLVRAAGVPARVAFGFTNGTNRQGDTYTLTNLNLHAWTEVYFNGIGWVPFDATPAASVPGSVRSEWAPDTDAPASVTPTPVSGGENPEAANGATDSKLAQEAGEESAAAAGSDQPKGPTWPLWVAAGVVLLLAVLAAPALRRALLRRRRERLSPARGSVVAGEPEPGEIRVLPAGEPAERARAEAHAAWAELVDTMVDFRVPVDPAETPRMTVERLAAQRLVAGTGAEAARLLGRAEERARYARKPLPGQRLAPAVRTFRKALAAETTWRTRAIAALLPPSVLQRWRHALVEAATSAVTTTGRLRDELLRWSPRRLLAARGR